MQEATPTVDRPYVAMPCSCKLRARRSHGPIPPPLSADDGGDSPPPTAESPASPRGFRVCGPSPHDGTTYERGASSVVSCCSEVALQLARRSRASAERLPGSALKIARRR